MYYLRDNLSLRNFILFQIDCILILISSYLVFAVKFGGFIPFTWLPFLEEAALISILCQLMFFVTDLYNIDTKISLSNIIVRILIAFSVSALVLTLFYLIFPSFQLSNGLFLYAILISLILIVFWRLLFAWTLNTINPTQKVIVFGTGSTAKMLANAIAQNGRIKYSLEGFVD